MFFYISAETKRYKIGLMVLVHCRNNAFVDRYCRQKGHQSLFADFLPVDKVSIGFYLVLKFSK